MEPRPCSRGNGARSPWPSPPEPLQWSHGLAAVETITPGPKGTRRPAFNGATALQPWKLAPAAQGAGHLVPSMEPRPCSRGNLSWGASCRDAMYLQWSHGLAAVETWLLHSPQRSRPRSFNGATALQPWKPGSRPLRWPGGPPLQWSHGLAAVETAGSDLAHSIRIPGGTIAGPTRRPAVSWTGARLDRAGPLTPTKIRASGCEAAPQHLAARISAAMRLSKSGQSDDCVPANFRDATNAQRADSL